MQVPYLLHSVVEELGDVVDTVGAAGFKETHAALVPRSLVAQASTRLGGTQLLAGSLLVREGERWCRSERSPGKRVDSGRACLR